MEKMNKELFIEEVKNLNIDINDDILNKLSIYANFLIEYNEHTNLTRIDSIEDIYLKHFYDSLTITKIIDLNTVNTMIDVGTGAGFPGVVIKIFYPNIKVDLLDSNNKKLEFLNQLIEKLGLTGIKTIHDRSEDYARNHLDSYDLVVARAVKNLPELSELCIPLVKVGGYFVSMKGEATEEIEKGTKFINKLNSSIEDTIVFDLPIEEATRTLIKIKKNDKTPKGYPRTYAQIKKNNM